MKMKTLACIFMTSFFIVAGIIVRAEQSPGTGQVLILEWQTTKGQLQIPESVIYHEAGSSLYVSNINGKPSEKNGQGFISKLSLEGEVINLKWAVGLDAPKGMAIVGDSLFVTDIDKLVEIALPTGKIIKNYPASDAGFLNDVAADSAGNLYVSDSSSTHSAIYILTSGELAVWIESPEIKEPNGLLMENARLLIGNSGNGCIKAINPENKTIEMIAEVGSKIDGLQTYNNGNYIVSDWKGTTSIVSAEGEVVVLLDTTEEKIHSADLCYVPEKNLIVVPTFFDNRVMAYRLK